MNKPPMQNPGESIQDPGGKSQRREFFKFNIQESKVNLADLAGYAYLEKDPVRAMTDNTITPTYDSRYVKLNVKVSLLQEQMKKQNNQMELQKMLLLLNNNIFSESVDSIYELTSKLEEQDRKKLFRALSNYIVHCSFKDREKARNVLSQIDLVSFLLQSEEIKDKITEISKLNSYNLTSVFRKSLIQVFGFMAVFGIGGYFIGPLFTNVFGAPIIGLLSSIAVSLPFSKLHYNFNLRKEEQKQFNLIKQKAEELCKMLD